MIQKIVSMIEWLGLAAFAAYAGVFLWPKSVIVGAVFIVATCALLFAAAKVAFGGSSRLCAPLGGAVLDLCILIFLPWSMSGLTAQESPLLYIPVGLAAIDLCYLIFDKKVRKAHFFATNSGLIGNILLDFVLIIYGTAGYFESTSHSPIVCLLLILAGIVDLVFNLRHHGRKTVA